MGKEACAQNRSRGRSVVELYNTARPHSQIAWQTPDEFASTFTPRRSLALRNANGSAQAPAASPAQKGKPNAGNELRPG
jgi:putative transposase